VKDSYEEYLIDGVFGDNVVRWIEGSETSYWFWLLSGRKEGLALFS
jgi:hypothetical protein